MFILEKDTYLIDAIASLNIKYQKACDRNIIVLL